MVVITVAKQPGARKSSSLAGHSEKVQQDVLELRRRLPGYIKRYASDDEAKADPHRKEYDISRLREGRVVGVLKSYKKKLAEIFRQEKLDKYAENPDACQITCHGKVVGKNGESMGAEAVYAVPTARGNVMCQKSGSDKTAQEREAQYANFVHDRVAKLNVGYTPVTLGRRLRVRVNGVRRKACVFEREGVYYAATWIKGTDGKKHFRMAVLRAADVTDAVKRLEKNGKNGKKAGSLVAYFKQIRALDRKKELCAWLRTNHKGKGLGWLPIYRVEGKNQLYVYILHNRMGKTLREKLDTKNARVGWRVTGVRIAKGTTVDSLRAGKGASLVVRNVSDNMVGKVYLNQGSPVEDKDGKSKYPELATDLALLRGEPLPVNEIDFVYCENPGKPMVRRVQRGDEANLKVLVDSAPMMDDAALTVIEEKTKKALDAMNTLASSLGVNATEQEKAFDTREEAENERAPEMTTPTKGRLAALEEKAVVKREKPVDVNESMGGDKKVLEVPHVNPFEPMAESEAPPVNGGDDDGALMEGVSEK